MLSNDSSISIIQKKRRPKTVPIVLAAALLLVAFYFCFGFFVIQPIGAIPDGATILIWRLGTNLPFVASADGILLKTTGSVSLLSRGMTLAALAEPIKQRKIVSLPYSETLYTISTGGVKLER